MIRFGFLVVAITLLALPACGPGNKSQSDARPNGESQAAPAAATPASTPQPTTGTLDILVPAGFTGGEYWVYLNGRIAKAPAEGAVDAGHAPYRYTVAKDGTRTVFLETGAALTWSAGGWVAEAASYLQSHPQDARHVIQTEELTLDPGKYTVEIAYYSPGGAASTDRSFPFAITQKVDVDIEAGQTARVIASLPADWSNLDPSVPLAGTFCPAESTANPEDISETLKKAVFAFRQDPNVVALRKAKFLWAPGAGRSVTIELPPEEGGAREFDGAEISDIANAIAWQHSFPSTAELTSCESSYPALSAVFAEAGAMAGVEEKEMESFKEFGMELSQSR